MTFIIKIFENLLNSFNTGTGGYSGRKLSACFAVITSGVITYQYMKPEYLAECLVIWLAFALLCLGIVTIEQIIKLKNESSNKQSHNS